MLKILTQDGCKFGFITVLNTVPGPGNPQYLKPFKKGQSGNPKGRPPKLPALDKLLDKVLGDEKDGVTAAETILAALRKRAAGGDVRAAEVLLDRAYGKPLQKVDATIKLGKQLEEESYD
jgi:hypothetical protein